MEKGKRRIDKFELINSQSPGDILMLTALVRDWKKKYLHTKFRVNTSSDTLFDNNPNVEKKVYKNLVFDTNAEEESKRIDSEDKDWFKFYTHYGDDEQYGRTVKNPYSIHEGGAHKKHFINGMIGYANAFLGLNIKLTKFKPDLYLSDAEKVRHPSLPKKYWIVFPGGKTDYRRKIWPFSNWEKVFSTFPDVNFVQLGGCEWDHIKPIFRNSNVINFTGMTTLREVLSLIYNSEGVICPITFGMHVAAAFDKRCIVIAGGGEHDTWEAYTRNGGAKVPHHYLHTCGQLVCCKNGGCWTGDCKNKASDGVQKCFKLITPKVVCEVLRRYV